MELKSVRVQNFRSVEDSGEFTVEHLTCLVGKNEAGKTAILQAIAGLNPHPATPFKYELERDYPKRFLARYKERHPTPANVITSRWRLSPATIEKIKGEFGPNVMTGDLVTITRGYETGQYWSLPISEAKAIEHLIAQANFSAPEKSQIGSPADSETLVTKLKALAPTNPKHKALLDIISKYRESRIAYRIIDICDAYLPQFMYFSNYDRMNAVVHLPTLKQQSKDQTLFKKDELRGDRLFYEFLEFSSVSLADILGTKTFESFNAKLRSASNILTSEILEYWTQNQDIEVQVNVNEGLADDPPPFNEGAVGRARIYNTLHKADTSFSERSAGFTWFFSFLIKFDRVKKEAADGGVFLLLDEPGLTLHGLAQADLLRFFDEKLSPHHQVIYSTHSPFMVPHTSLMSSRIVEDLVELDDRKRRIPTGTKVREDVLNADRDSVFPLQGALGYSLTQSLFVGKHTILVEGPGDILYLKALSAELGRRKREELDPAWVLCPTGGIDKIQSFVSLFGGNNLDVISLSDFTKKDRQKLDTLKKSNMLKEGGVLTIADFVTQEEADVEDLFAPEVFCSIVNAAYGLEDELALDSTKLAAADENTVRQVKKAEAHFRVLPETIPTFDHFRPAAWLLANPTILRSEEEPVLETLERVEALFVALNALRAN